jgi:hypothetical protein
MWSYNDSRKQLSKPMEHVFAFEVLILEEVYQLAYSTQNL